IQQLTHFPCQLRAVVWVEEETVLPFLDELGHTRPAAHHGRFTMQPALHHDQTEPLDDGWQNREGTPLVHGIELILRKVTRKNHIPGDLVPDCQRSQLLAPSVRLRQAEATLLRTREAPVPN